MLLVRHIILREMFQTVESLKLHFSFEACEPRTHKQRQEEEGEEEKKKRRRRRGKILIFKHCGLHSSEILVAPVRVYVCVSLCV